MEALKDAEYSSKEKFKLPEGAEIIRKEFRIRVEEIENGFLVYKNYDITYQAMGSSHQDYAHYSKKYYSKDNPMKLDLSYEDTPLEDKLD